MLSKDTSKLATAMTIKTSVAMLMVTILRDVVSVPAAVPEIPEAGSQKTLDPAVIWIGAALFVAGMGAALLFVAIHRRRKT